MADVRDAGRQVGGEIAHDAVSAGKPVFVGGYASASAPANVSADGDICSLWLDRSGRVQIILHASAAAVGMDSFRNTAITNAAVAVKSSAGNLYWLHVENAGTAKAYLNFYDGAAGGITVGSTTPTLSLVIPASGGYTDPLPLPVAFATAITIAATTTPTGGTAPGTALLVNLGYKPDSVYD